MKHACFTNILTVQYTSADLYEKEPGHSLGAYLTIKTVQASSLHNKTENKPILHVCLLFNFCSLRLWLKITEK